jgi:aminoglycoside phosphotransferase (APT) family kinase protein
MTAYGGSDSPACRAAVEVAQELGIAVKDPVLIQETNNTVVWLRPHEIIAKVGTNVDNAEGLSRERRVATALSALGAPVARPLPGIGPTRHQPTGFLVTLWCRLEHDSTATVSEATVGRSLRVLHEALALCQVELPSFRFALERARAVLSSDARIPALAKDDRMLLCTAFDDLLAQLDDRKFLQRALHGEPHDGNHLLTPSGLRWIDFEGACLGPPEWDLAFLPDGARAAFTDVDLDLLALLEVLDSARVATWCWVQAHFPEMRATASTISSS